MLLRQEPDMSRNPGSPKRRKRNDVVPLPRLPNHARSQSADALKMIRCQSIRMSLSAIVREVCNRFDWGWDELHVMLQPLFMHSLLLTNFTLQDVTELYTSAMLCAEHADAGMVQRYAFFVTTLCDSLGISPKCADCFKPSQMFFRAPSSRRIVCQTCCVVQNEMHAQMLQPDSLRHEVDMTVHGMRAMTKHAGLGAEATSFSYGHALNSFIKINGPAIISGGRVAMVKYTNYSELMPEMKMLEEDCDSLLMSKEEMQSVCINTVVHEARETALKHTEDGAHTLLAQEVHTPITAPPLRPTSTPLSEVSWPSEIEEPMTQLTPLFSTLHHDA